jgi:hypothetical protein
LGEMAKGKPGVVTMKWFGVSWGAPMCADCPQVPPPVGEFCTHCDEALAQAEQEAKEPRDIQ